MGWVFLFYFREIWDLVVFMCVIGYVRMSVCGCVFLRFLDTCLYVCGLLWWGVSLYVCEFDRTVEFVSVRVDSICASVILCVCVCL